MNDLFFPLNATTEIKDKILEIVHNGEEWQPYYNFQVKEIPVEVIAEDSFLRDLYSIEPFDAGVTMMHPMSVYDWHVDEKRGVSINMLMESGFSLTMYTTLDTNLVRPIQVVEYKPDHYHFFNTQMPHAVFNFDKPRYLFTLDFYKDKTELDYKDLLNILRGMGLTHG